MDTVMVKMINEFAERCARKHPVMDYSFGSSTVPAALKHICLNLPTLDLAFFTTALLTDNTSHEDYARWLLALNYSLGPLPKFISKYHKFSTAFELNLAHGQVTFTHEQVAKKVNCMFATTSLEGSKNNSSVAAINSHSRHPQGVGSGLA